MSEFGDKACAERHDNCKGRMDSHGISLNERVHWRTFYWTLGVIITLGSMLIFGSFGYTKTVADEVKNVVTKSDMKEYQEEMVKAIKEAVK